MNTIASLFGNNSKKLTVFVVASAVVLLKDYFSLSIDQIQALEILAGVYIGGQSIADFGKGAAQVEAKKEKP